MKSEKTTCLIGRKVNHCLIMDNRCASQVADVCAYKYNTLAAFLNFAISRRKNLSLKDKARIKLRIII